MNVRPRYYRIFLASPSDTEPEREIVANLVQRLSLEFRDELDLHLVRWEDVPPGLTSETAQAMIDDYVEPERCDLVIGVFWKKFGHPNESGFTPTEYEIRRAWEHWLQTGAPRLMVYFCNYPATYNDVEDLEQRTAVLRFRDWIRSQAKARALSPVTCPPKRSTKM